MKSLYGIDGIDEKGWERAMSKPTRKATKRKPKATTLTVDQVYAALREQANQVLSALPGWIADCHKRYGDWPAASRRDEYLRDSITTQVDWTWGQLLGLRGAVYGIRALFSYASSEWERFDDLASDIDNAMTVVSKDARPKYEGGRVGL